MDALVSAAERGWLPDPVVRLGIRRLLRERLREAQAGAAAGHEQVLDAMRSGPIAVAVEEANREHYEVPASFFRLVLGPRLKYSSGLWEPGDDLARSEERMLEISARRAGVEDGMDLLDLGCGWGSLSLWLAQRFPACRILAVSNSASQREFIESRCREEGIGTVEVVTADMNDFQAPRRFHRVLSVEMFEHMRNYVLLLRRITGWLRPEGKLFVHHFCHREIPYFFEADGHNDWMARYFFTGGMMPSRQMLQAFPDDLVVEEQWSVDGTHYARTLRAWLVNMDARRAAVLEVFRDVYGKEAPRWFQRWRLFFLACAELFDYRGGAEWLVSHLLLAPAGGSSS
jgi:cyclopropane-fatty-acyl-phospholipid synthase